MSMHFVSLCVHIHIMVYMCMCMYVHEPVLVHAEV